ncbi:FBD-associated F-box protein [Trifolium repens]|nr:FBD-associated F-box protein [Trifolium repens]
MSIFNATVLKCGSMMPLGLTFKNCLHASNNYVDLSKLLINCTNLFILPCFNSNLLVNVLKKCCILQVLIVQSNKEEPSSLRTWEPQSTTVPKCLKSHLTYIRIEDELTFAEYILQNGLVLEKMLIFVDTSMDIMNKYSSVKRLLDIPRGSAKCQLKFDPVVSS